MREESAPHSCTGEKGITFLKDASCAQMQDAARQSFSPDCRPIGPSKSCPRASVGDGPLNSLRRAMTGRQRCYLSNFLFQFPLVRAPTITGAQRVSTHTHALFLQAAARVGGLFSVLATTDADVVADHWFLPPSSNFRFSPHTSFYINFCALLAVHRWRQCNGLFNYSPKFPFFFKNLHQLPPLPVSFTSGHLLQCRHQFSLRRHQFSAPHICCTASSIDQSSLQCVQSYGQPMRGRRRSKNLN